uniref:39S ribosomal protein L41, mitochondrial n=1 Tax=Amphiprion ocellaris TaxID=80972 RepID=A0A3Q1AVL0_AMPOC
MGVLSTLMRGLIRGADRMSEFTSKRGSRTHNKGRGVRPTGLRLSSRKVLYIRTMIPEFVVPHLEGFKLKPYISYRSLKGTDALHIFIHIVFISFGEAIKDRTYRLLSRQKAHFSFSVIELLLKADSIHS